MSLVSFQSATERQQTLKQENTAAFSLGLVQMPMSWTTEGNCETILQFMSHYARLDLLVFPELALSGFHRQVREQSAKQLIEPALQTIKERCRDLSLSIGLGLPFEFGELFYNRYVLISNQGELLKSWDKIGLTESEGKFFSPGTSRQSVQFKTIWVNCLLCRETSDKEWFMSQFSSQGNRTPNLVLWPSYIEFGESRSCQYAESARAIARDLNSYVCQANWPCSLNQSILEMGKSQIIGPNGEIAAQLPVNKTGVGIFDFQCQDFRFEES